jgi:hypothetical protein
MNTHKTTGSSVATTMGTRLDTVPEVLEVGLVRASIDNYLLGGLAEEDTASDVAGNAVGVDIIARAERYVMRGKWPVGDASRGSNTITTESGHRIEDGRLDEVTPIGRLIPIPRCRNLLDLNVVS